MIRLRTGLLSLTGIMLGLWGTFAQATSFDCAKAVSFAEIQICNNPQLQEMDERLNSTYAEALLVIQDKAKFRGDQRAWLKQRDACTYTDCVFQAIDQRLDTMDALAHPAPPALPVIKAAPVLQPIATHEAPISAPAVRHDLTEDSPSKHPQPGYTTLNANQTQHPQTTSTKPQPVVNDPHEFRPLKITLLVMGIVLVICIWLHTRGSMTIYSCYTDALWTTLTPFLAAGTYFMTRMWLELSTQTALIATASVFCLMLVQVLIQTFRHNGFSIFFILALYAKLLLFTIYFLSMAVLIFGSARTAAERRRQRNAALGGSILFALLTGWMTRNRSFSHIDDYIAGRT